MSASRLAFHTRRRKEEQHGIRSLSADDVFRSGSFEGTVPLSG